MQHFIEYGTIEFKKDSYSVVSSRIDTIFRYKYWVADGYLTLVDEKNDTTRDKILTLNNSLLYLESLRKSKEIHRYRKVRKKFRNERIIESAMKP